MLPSKLTWLEPTYITILSARKYTMIYLYNIAFIRPSNKSYLHNFCLVCYLILVYETTLYHCWFILTTRSLPIQILVSSEEYLSHIPRKGICINMGNIDKFKIPSRFRAHLIIAFHSFVTEWCLQFKATDTGPPYYLTS